MFLAAQKRHAENSLWYIRIAAEVDCAAVRRPADKVDRSPVPPLRQYIPVARFRLHDRDLGIAINHGLKRKQMTVWRKARVDRDFRSVQADGRPACGGRLTRQPASESESRG